MKSSRSRFTEVTEHDLLVTIATMALQMPDLTAEDIKDTFKNLNYGNVLVEAREMITIGKRFEKKLKSMGVGRKRK